MKILYLILIPVFIFAQWSSDIADIVGDSDMDDISGYTPSGATLTKETSDPIDGAYLLVTSTGAGASGYRSPVTVKASTDYKVDGWIKTAYAALFAVYNNNTPGWVVLPTGEGFASWTNKVQAFTTPAGCTSVRIYCRTSGHPVTAQFDKVYVREKLDTLYIDPASGLDTNYGELSTPVKTWEEYTARGGNHGGVVVQLVSGAWIDITSNGGLLVTETQDKGFKEDKRRTTRKTRKIRLQRIPTRRN